MPCAPTPYLRPWPAGCRLLPALLGSCLAVTAHAQDGSGHDLSAEAGAEAGGEQDYVDRLIDGGALVPSIVLSDEETRDNSGNPRSLMVELGGSRIRPRSRVTGIDTSGIDRVQQEAGLSVSGRYQTDNFGTLGLDAQLRRGSRSGPLGNDLSDRWNGSLALTSRDLPLGDGWLADSSLGTISVPMIALVRRQTRFYLPTSPVMGGSVSFNGYRSLSKGGGASDLEPDTSLNFGMGEPGLLGGLRLSNFSGLSGLLLTGGGQVRLSPRWSAGVQAISVDKARDPYAVILRNGTGEAQRARFSSQAAFGTLAYSDGGLRLQANAIWSNRSSSFASPDSIYREGKAAGGLLDASLRKGRTVHSGGIYYFAPGLGWGTSAILNNAYGGYYRISSSSQRWRWTLNLDAVDSVDGTGSSGFIANADLRRKLNFSTSVGLNSSLRVANGQTSTQLLGYVDFSSGLGTSRAQAGWSHDRQSDLYRVGFDQNWSLPASMPAGSRLSTQISYEHRNQSGRSPFWGDARLAERADSFGAALSAGVMPFAGVTIDASVAYNSNSSSSSSGVYGPLDSAGGALGILSSQQGEAFSASIVATARLSSRWSLTASYTDSTSSLASRYGLNIPGSTPLDGQDSLRRSSFRLQAGYLTLRYAVSAGRQKGGLGMRHYPVGGTGTIEGRVFLDANDNRLREPSEKGVAGIVVMLDGMQAVRTDEAGFYRFEGVVDGAHRITLNADALPLPWLIERDDKRGWGEPYSALVEVKVRGTTLLDIAAGRE